MLHLRSVKFDHLTIRSQNRYPFSLPLFQTLEELPFHTPVTFFVGENGTGKSTLLSALAAAIGSIVVGGASLDNDPDLVSAKELSHCLKLQWHAKTRKGFFLRAEDFINYTKRIAQLRTEMENDIIRVDQTFHDRSDYARSLAKMPYAGQLHALRESYGEGLDKQSHGESFFSLFHSRFVPGGLYLLDEPETPLSPLKQLSLIALLKDMENQGGQFIIATHSPLLMAYPGATIFSFDHTPLQPIAYNEIEHVNLTRDFLNNPDAFLRRL